jgi:hypothetical protein
MKRTFKGKRVTRTFKGKKVKEPGGTGALL